MLNIGKFFQKDECTTKTSQEYISEEAKYSPSNYEPLPVTLTFGEGCWLYDVEGKKYLDMMSAYSAVSLGHRNPEILKTMFAQATRLSLCSRAFHTDVLGMFLKKLCELTGLDKAVPMNTGAEGVETAVKGARRWGYDVKGIPDGEAEIIVASGNFHGRTTTVISFSSEAEYKRGFGPLTPGFKFVPFGDADSLEKAITPNTCAFIVEPIQGEGGIIIPPDGYIQKAYDICKSNNVLLILDEVQTGFGRTGKMFAFEHSGIKPDGLILGKALGGGVFPVSAFVGRRDVIEVFTPGSHGSTFGGNPLGAAIASKTIDLMVEGRLAERSDELGKYLMAQLSEFKTHRAVRDIRGIGLFVGLELDMGIVSAKQFCKDLANHGVLSKDTHETVVRFAPPLTIAKEEIDFCIDRVGSVLENY